MGGGVWCRQVVRQSLAMGFKGDIFRIHPSPDLVEGIPAFAHLSDLPYPPDAVFLGVNRHATLDAVATLSAMGAGGAVCFASGFAESLAEDATSAAMQAQLVTAAGDMPLLGPNCYGFVNALDGALLWPDQHGCQRVARGVAILTQSSNIAINLTMQRRGLPIAFMVTCGNMAQTTQAEIAMALLEDPRVTAIGLHVEGFDDVAQWHRFACKVAARGIPVLVLKVGVSDQAQQATVSHTASLAGSDAGASALLRHLGMARVNDLPTFLETLMLLHCNGALQSNTVASISCSGGEASLVSDLGVPFDVTFPALTPDQHTALSDALGPMVALSNPLDYNTYIWGDVGKMTAAWLPMAADHIGMVLIVLDYPHTDASAWDCATQAAITLRKARGRPIAVVATLPELMPEETAKTLLAAGVTPLHGVREALGAISAAARIGPPVSQPPLQGGATGIPVTWSEAKAKRALAACGLSVPRGVVAVRQDLQQAAANLRPPLVLKALGLAHKSDVGAVRLHLTPGQIDAAAQEMEGTAFLIEEMAQGGVCELLVGVTRDPAHGFVMTLAAGGVLTELWQDRVSILLPAGRADIADRLTSLRIYPLLTGYRNTPAAHLAAVLDAIMAVQAYVVQEAASLYELEINPLICTPETAVAVDALIVRLAEPQ